MLSVVAVVDAEIVVVVMLLLMLVEEVVVVVTKVTMMVPKNRLVSRVIQAFPIRPPCWRKEPPKKMNKHLPTWETVVVIIARLPVLQSPKCTIRV